MTTIPNFLRAGLASADVDRIEQLVGESRSTAAAVLWATWSPTQRTLVAGTALRGAITYWMASPCDSEAEGLAVSRSLFDTMEHAVAAGFAAGAIDKARLQ